MNFNQKLISFIVFTTLPFLIGFGWKYLFNNTNGKGVDLSNSAVDTIGLKIENNSTNIDTIMLPQLVDNLDTLHKNN